MKELELQSERVHEYANRFGVTIEEIEASKPWQFVLKQIIEDEDYIASLTVPRLEAGEHQFGNGDYPLPEKQSKMYAPALVAQYAKRYGLSRKQLSDAAVMFILKSKIDSDLYVTQLRQEQAALKNAIQLFGLKMKQKKTPTTAKQETK